VCVCVCVHRLVQKFCCWQLIWMFKFWCGAPKSCNGKDVHARICLVLGPFLCIWSIRTERSQKRKERIMEVLKDVYRLYSILCTIEARFCTTGRSFLHSIGSLSWMISHKWKSQRCAFFGFAVVGRVVCKLVLNWSSGINNQIKRYK
jgi:hypothetical protein